MVQREIFGIAVVGSQEAISLTPMNTAFQGLVYMAMDAMLDHSCTIKSIQFPCEPLRASSAKLFSADALADLASGDAVSNEVQDAVATYDCSAAYIIPVAVEFEGKKPSKALAAACAQRALELLSLAARTENIRGCNNYIFQPVAADYFISACSKGLRKADQMLQEDTRLSASITAVADLSDATQSALPLTRAAREEGEREAVMH